MELETFKDILLSDVIAVLKKTFGSDIHFDLHVSNKHKPQPIINISYSLRDHRNIKTYVFKQIPDSFEGKIVYKVVGGFTLVVAPEIEVSVYPTSSFGDLIFVNEDYKYPEELR